MDCQTQVKWSELEDSVHVFGHEYVANEQVGERALLQGSMQVWELDEGLLLYRTDVKDLCSLRTSNALDPSLKVFVLLSGHTRVRYGAQWFDMDATHRPCALLVQLSKEDVFMRQWQTGRSERKLVLSCSLAWLRGKGLLGSLAFLQVHRWSLRWDPSRKMLALAEQLHHEAQPGRTCDALLKLLWQAKAMALLHAALESARASESQTEPRVEIQRNDLPMKTYQRLTDLREWMCAHDSQGMGLAQVAKYAGMSVSSLQKHFPLVSGGLSVSGFLRQQRLLRARRVLEETGGTVLQAAEAAGYASVTHFAKAFRQQFGCAPSRWRSRA